MIQVKCLIFYMISAFHSEVCELFEFLLPMVWRRVCIAKTFDLGDPRFYEDFLVPHSCLSPINRTATPWARATNNVKKPQSQMCESCRKLDLRFLSNKTETSYVSVTHLILRLLLYKISFNYQKKLK